MLESVKWEQGESLLNFLSPGGWTDNRRYWLGQGLAKLNCGRVVLECVVEAKSRDAGMNELRFKNQLCPFVAV